MILREENVNRLIIYFLYDKQGIADDYVLYMLKALKCNCTELMVVSNGDLTEKSRMDIQSIADKLIERENKGFDVWAYKTGIDSYGWSALSKFDEMIMMNFTIMGPIYPFEEMFKKMDSKDLDFWGITKFHKYEEGDPFGTIEVGYIPEHIQSHFIAVRKNMLCSKSFQHYWNNMGAIKDYRDAVGKHEAMFTLRFSQKGFKWDVYADVDDGFNNHPILCATEEMLEKHRCPIFKRRSFMQSYDNIIHDTIGQCAIEAYKFIDEKTDYDVDMIWQNILRLENQADIKKNMQLNYILPADNSKLSDSIIMAKKIALVMHIYFDDLMEYCLHYARSMPENADIYLTVPSEKNKEVAEKIFSVLPNKVDVMVIQNRGRDVSALLVATKKFIMNYDYVCFMHDKKVVQLDPKSIGYGFSYKCFENLLTSKDFVKNVIDTFENNPRLGMLMPAPPNHGDYYFTLGMEWGSNYKITKELADKLGIKVPIEKGKEPIAPLGTMFWFRPQALKMLFERDWKYEDFPKEPNKLDGSILHAIERIYGYVVQQQGFYPAWVFCEKGASIEITNLNYMIRTLNDIMFNEGIGGGPFDKVRDGLRDMCESGGGLGTVNVKRQIPQLKLYVNTGNGYSEENSIEKVIIERKTDKIKIVYDGLDKYEKITGIRLDPGEASGVTVKNMAVIVTYSDGTVKKIGKKDTVANGITIEDKLVFILGDPQIYFKLNHIGTIVKVEVTGDFSSGVAYSDMSYIYQKALLSMHPVRNILSIIKNKVKGIVK